MAAHRLLGKFIARSDVAVLKAPLQTLCASVSMLNIKLNGSIVIKMLNNHRLLRLEGKKKYRDTRLAMLGLNEPQDCWKHVLWTYSAGTVGPQQHRKVDPISVKQRTFWYKTSLVRI